MQSDGSILLIIAAVAVGLWLASRLEKLYKHRKAEHVTNEPNPFHQPIEPVPAPIPALPIAVLPAKENPLNRLKDRLRERKAAGAGLAGSVASSMNEFGDQVIMDDVLKAAAQIGYPPKEIAVFMVQRQYQLQDIAVLLAQESDIGVEELADVIMPLVKGETVSARAEGALDIVKKVVEVDDDDFLPLPARLGCSIEEAATIVYKNTDLCLGSVVRGLKLSGSPDIVARIASKLDVDLSNDDEYSGLREDDEVEFEPAVLILRACGKDAGTIIATENAHEEFSDDRLDIIFSALSVAGFSNTEIMGGINEADIIAENSWAAIVRGALENKSSMEDVVSFLKREGVDPGELDDEMRELEFEISERVDVLHALLHRAGMIATEEAAAIGSNQ